MRSKIFTRTVGYWPLQESSGQALDYSGNENHASTTAVSSYGVSGPLGASAMEFDGSSDGIDLPSLGSSMYTISFWLNSDEALDGSGSGMVPFDSDFSASEGIWVGNTEAFNGISSRAVGILSDKVDAETSVASSESFPKDTWHFIVFRWNGSHYDIFVNGEKKPVDAGDGGHAELWSSASAHIGYRGSNSDEYFDGKIAHVRVWDYPLPEASIKALYNASKGGFSESDSRTL